MDTFTMTIEVGGVYLVNPLNPRCRKNRGRFCRVLSFDSDDGRVLVMFLDTKRKALIRISDLANFEEDIDI